MRIDRHIFGSYSGYNTLSRSPGVTGEDARVLESGAYAFGQSHDRSYLKSLARNPAYFTRVLPGGRRGLTRVLEGNPDDNNRPTLLLITLIVSQRDWDSVLLGDVGLLLDNKSLWEWDGSPQTPTLDIEPAGAALSIPRKSVDKILALVSEAEKSLGGRRTLVVSEDDYSYAELRALEMLIPPAARRQFTSACRGLSGQLPVSVNALAAEGQGRAGYRYSPGANHLSAYATFLSGTEFSVGTIPVESIVGYRQFAIGEARPGAAIPSQSAALPLPLPTPADRARSGTPWLVLAVAALVALLLAGGTFIAGKSVGSSETQLAERAKQEEQRQLHEQAMNDAVKRQSSADQDRVKKAMGVTGASMDELAASAASKLQDAQNAAITAARDSAAERDRYKSGYQAELTRQRDRFDSLRTEASSAMDVKKIADISAAAQTLSRVEGELEAIDTDWPQATEDEKKWTAAVQPTRDRVHVAARAANDLARISVLLEECEDTIHSSGANAAVGVTANVEEAADLAKQLPARIESPDVDLSPLKAKALARAQKIRQWLGEQAKLASAKPPPPEAFARDDWWHGLNPKQQERIQKLWDKIQEEMRKKQQEKEAAGGGGPPRPQGPGSPFDEQHPQPRDGSGAPRGGN